MECTEQVKFMPACEGGACVEESFHHGHVHVRTNRFPDRAVILPQDEWDRLVAEAQATHRVVLEAWFPPDVHGDFASTITDEERIAFERRVLLSAR